MNNLTVSNFSYCDKCIIKKTTKQSKKVYDGKIIGETIINAILTKYGFLTLKLVRKCLEYGGHKKISAAKTLKSMQYQGLIDKYTIYYPEDMERNNIDVYILTGEMLEECRRKRLYDFKMTNIPYILEMLTLAQWHISMLMKCKAKEEMYNVTFETDLGYVLTMPSLVKLRTSISSTIHICSMPVTKAMDKKELGKFLIRISQISKYMDSKRKYSSFVICLICESQQQIEETSKLLYALNQTRNLFVIYSIDAITSDLDINPMSMIYDSRHMEGVTFTQLIKLQKDKTLITDDTDNQLKLLTRKAVHK